MHLADEYTPPEFQRLIEFEGERLELKTGIGRAIRETLVAFSNTEGGAVLIGVNNERVVVGKRADQGAFDAIHEQAQTCRDLGGYEVREIYVGDTPVVAVIVSPRVEGFAQTSQGVVLVRRGGNDTPLFGDDLTRFVNERTLRRFEEHPTEFSLDQADSQLVAELADAQGWESSDAAELSPRLVERRLATSEGVLTIAGALFLTDPSDSLRLDKVTIEVRRYPDEGVDYDRREEFRGPIHHQLIEASQFLMDELGTDFVVAGMRRHNLPKLPEVVVREAIANAVAHRSYEMTGTAIVIEIRTDRVVVSSPGSLPEPVTTENIRQAQSARNQIVLRLLRHLRLAEDAGRGVDVMQDEMESALLEPPTFVERASGVEVTLPLVGQMTSQERAWVSELEGRGSLQARDRPALVLAARGEVLTNRRLREALGVDASEARSILQRLRDCDLLVQRGNRGGTEYTIAENVAPAGSSEYQLDVLILDAAQEAPLTNERVRQLTGLGREEALAILKRLVADGYLRQVGQKRGTRYELEE